MMKQSSCLPHNAIAGLILGLRPTNERRCYFVTSPELHCYVIIALLLRCPVSLRLKAGALWYARRGQVQMNRSILNICDSCCHFKIRRNQQVLKRTNMTHSLLTHLRRISRIRAINAENVSIWWHHHVLPSGNKALPEPMLTKGQVHRIALPISRANIYPFSSNVALYSKFISHMGVLPQTVKIQKAPECDAQKHKYNAKKVPVGGKTNTQKQNKTKQQATSLVTTDEK